MMDASRVIDVLLVKGHGVDIALVFIAFEYVFLLVRAPSQDRAKTAMALILALGPGACLMLALRASLTGTDPIPIAFWLTLSLPLHLMDVARRRF